jgi:hypothetical protein
MTPKRILGLAIAASVLASSAALAATETPERVRGTITSATADAVTVDTNAHNPLTITLTSNTTYRKVEKSNQCSYTPRVYKRGAPSVGPAISPGWPEWFSE